MLPGLLLHDAFLSHKTGLWLRKVKRLGWMDRSTSRNLNSYLFCYANNESPLPVEQSCWSYWGYGQTTYRWGPKWESAWCQNFSPNYIWSFKLEDLFDSWLVASMSVTRPTLVGLARLTSPLLRVWTYMWDFATSNLIPPFFASI